MSLEIKTQEYLSNRRVLIVDSSPGRLSIRQVLLQLGMKLSNMQTAESYDEAYDTMGSFTPHIIFAEHPIGNHSISDLVRLHKQNLPSRLEAAFFMISDKTSNSMAGVAADFEVDELIIRPFSLSELVKRVMGVFSLKLSASPEDRTLDQINSMIIKSEFDDALEAITHARAKQASTSALSYFEGQALKHLGKKNEAKTALRRAVKSNPEHYRSYAALLDLLIENSEYKEAYEVGSELVERFPVSLKRLPDLIRLSVLNQKFDDILKFYEVLSKLDTVDAVLSNHLVIAMVVSGKSLIRRGENERAIEILRNAQNFTRGRANLLIEIGYALLSADGVSDAKIVLEKIPEEFRKTNEALSFDFEVLDRTADAPKIVRRGLELIKQGVRSPRIFEILIVRSIEMKRRLRAIEVLVFEAIKLFPESREVFELLAEKTPRLPTI